MLKPKRAIKYLEQKINKNLPNAEIKQFKVSREFRNTIDNMAIKEKEVKFVDPGKIKPVIADPTKARYQYGLREEQLKLLEENIIKGSGKNGK